MNSQKTDAGLALPKFSAMSVDTGAPLIYSQLLAAMVIGYLVFADWPDGLSFLGLGIIMVSGVWSFWFAIRQARILH